MLCVTAHVELLRWGNVKVEQATVLAWVVSCIIFPSCVCLKRSTCPPTHVHHLFKLLIEAQNLRAFGNFPQLAWPNTSLIYFVPPDPLWTWFVFFNFVPMVTQLFISWGYIIFPTRLCHQIDVCWTFTRWNLGQIFWNLRQIKMIICHRISYFRRGWVGKRPVGWQNTMTLRFCEFRITYIISVGVL